MKKRILKRTDLVYVERIDYCDRIVDLGVPGTGGRACSNQAAQRWDDMRSCDVFCCDRGYREALVQQKFKCNCHFKWCCQMKCDVCDETILTHRCR